MIAEISQQLKEKFKLFSLSDNIVFNNKLILVDDHIFQEIKPTANQEVTFIDGGQAEIISGGNLNLSFIRVYSQTMQGQKKIRTEKIEFYILVTAKTQNSHVWYESKIFPVLGNPEIDEQDVSIDSNDSSIRTGAERAPIGKVAGMARRFAELSLASKQVGLTVLDGTLQSTYKNEEKYLSKLNKNVCALAKTCSLFTTSGNNPVVLLKKLSPYPVWNYFVDERTYFVKLHQRAKHVFRFEGEENMLTSLIPYSADPLFLGYPYGLVLADKLARVSNAEKNSLRMKFLLRAENRELADYVNASNAHEILDSLG